MNPEPYYPAHADLTEELLDREAQLLNAIKGVESQRNEVQRSLRAANLQLEVLGNYVVSLTDDLAHSRATLAEVGRVLRHMRDSEGLRSQDVGAVAGLIARVG